RRARWTAAARSDGAGEDDQVTASICVAPEMPESRPPTRNRWRGSQAPLSCGRTAAIGAETTNAAATPRVHRAWWCTFATRSAAPFGPADVAVIGAGSRADPWPPG